MIRKVQGNEYLKRYDNMTAQERQEYEGRVGQWLNDHAAMLAGKGDVFEARLQNVLQVSTTWNDQECAAFEEGVRLLSALAPAADTWLPDMLYVKSAKRAIKQMFEVLCSVSKGDVADIHTVKANVSVRIDVSAAKESLMQAGATFRNNTGNGNIAGGDNEGESENEEVRGKTEEVHQPSSQPSDLVPARPKHIDQYVHLLPQKTQERAAQVQGLYRELDNARSKLQLLMDDPTASPAYREAWAKKATNCDNTLRKIFNELDAEWAKLVKEGRVVVDDLGNARVKEDGRGKTEDDSAVSHQPSDITQDLTSEQRARRRDLRKWLTDTRRGNGAAREERVRQWYVNFSEYLALEGDKAFEDERIREAISHYGIDIEKLKTQE